MSYLLASLLLEEKKKKGKKNAQLCIVLVASVPVFPSCVYSFTVDRAL